MAEGKRQSTRTIRKNAELSRMFIKEEVRARCKKITEILKKSEEDRTVEDKRLLDLSPDVAKDILKRSKTRKLAKERQLEVEDERSILVQKSIALADAIKKSKSLVVYTGAGISTAASIPDYRGPNGVWTLLQQGKQIKAQDLSDAEPTFTHMAVSQLFHEKKLRHVVSQNCDGLHVRSGLPCYILSEVHGNMYLEICTECSPQREYMRLFDVTEKTGVRRHKTGRHCHRCKAHLRDTIVHFGEKSPNKDSPYNWEEAADAADDADLILCLGSSLKVLKKYSCLWHTHLPPSQRPDLFIVNLMWTPKDDSAALKINGRCDDVMRIVMHRLGFRVPKYDKFDDPIFRLATALKPEEVKTTTKKILVKPECRSSKAVQYYEGDSEIEAELRNLGVKGKNDCKRRRRVKPERYDPDIPTKTDVKRVRTKAELKQEPPGNVMSENSIKAEVVSSHSLKPEPGPSSGILSHSNPAGINLPCFSTDMAFNPVALTGVPWMLPNLGLLSNPLPDPLMMYSGMMPQGMVPPFIPPQPSCIGPSGTSEVNALNVVSSQIVSAEAARGAVPEPMHDNLLRSTAVETRRNKKHRRKKFNTSESGVAQADGSVNQPAIQQCARTNTHEPEPVAERITNTVALEHSYTIPLHAVNAKRKFRKPHAETNTSTATQTTNVCNFRTQSNIPQPETAKEPTLSEDNASPRKSNKRCPTIKQLLEKPSLLNKTKSDISVPKNINEQSVSRQPIHDLVKGPNSRQATLQGPPFVRHPLTPASAKSDVQNQKSQHLSPGVNGIIPATNKPDPASDSVTCGSTSGKPKLSSVPSITHAIEMVKLQQQGALTKDSTNVKKTIPNPVQTPVCTTPQSLLEPHISASVGEASKSEPCTLLSQLCAPPIAPMFDVILQNQPPKDHLHDPSKPSTSSSNCSPATLASITSLSCIENTSHTKHVSSSSNSSQTAIFRPNVESKVLLQTRSKSDLESAVGGNPMETCIPVTSKVPEMHAKSCTIPYLAVAEEMMQSTETQNVGQHHILQKTSVQGDHSSASAPKKSDASMSASNPLQPDLCVSGNVLSPVITTQALQQALTRLGSTASIAIPPKVADLVLPGPPTAEPCESSGRNDELVKQAVVQPQTQVAISSSSQTLLGFQVQNPSQATSQALLKRDCKEVPQKTDALTRTPSQISTDVSPLDNVQIAEQPVSNTAQQIPHASRQVVSQPAATASTVVPINNPSYPEASSAQAIQMLKQARPQLQGGISPPKALTPRAGIRLPIPTASQYVPQTVDNVTTQTEMTPPALPQHNEESVRREGVNVVTTETVNTLHQPRQNTVEEVSSPVHVTRETHVITPRKPPHSQQQNVERLTATLSTATTTSTCHLPVTSMKPHSSALSGSPAKIPILTSPVDSSHVQTRDPSKVQMHSVNTSVVHSQKLMAPKSESTFSSFVTQSSNRPGVQSLNGPRISGTDPILPPGGVFANPQLAQAFFEGMNQAFSAQLMSQMAMTQLGLQHQIPSGLPFLNPLMSQVEHAQMLGLPLSNLGVPGVPLVDPGLLGALQYGANLVSPTGMLGQPPNHAMPQAIAITPTSQGTKKTSDSNCSKSRKKSRESQCNVVESQQYAPEGEQTKSVDLASKNCNPTEPVATTSKSNQLDETSHLKCSINQSENSGIQSLPGSNLNENSTEIITKAKDKKDRSDSQDSNSTASDGTADSESPISTPTTTSVPGWFGKGLNLKKGRRKRLK